MTWNLDYHKQFFDHLAQIMHVSHSGEWYKVKREDVYNLGGQQLLQQCYNGSLYKVELILLP